ncbi:FKBP-type peptidyl-prolyl cis-trans isomerase [Lysobacter sp. TY2-98]|uniref:FKBP-type peptidyl-prolyl cis-trans isomerase N-terminal domain-containing protein n=1 Tax=Lysobacter sp. TY2-98 TaxID=2290922 RepID=UPI000E1FEE52|nr:FKBP-type peptidyl-prolyl cis-trans isomerase N-terminal domain-containing protein [Lysobacter sp. TY2-98]AXK72005.1 FKBP-type peptidyl-prolyl cis-trans isomerase [Lysobacter sp. TY2-98]
MKFRLMAVAAAAFVVAGAASAQDITSDKGKLSYALGFKTGADAAELIDRGEQLDLAAITKGLQDAYAKKQPAVPVDQLQKVLQDMQTRLATKAKAEWDKAAAENKGKSDAFILANKAKPGIKVLPSGVQYRVIENGTGAKPTMASTVALEVAGPFPWGNRPQQAQAPQKIPSIKVSQIEMPAMREVIQQMPVGSKWEVTLPADKAYGADPRTGFPPNVAVVFEIKLVSSK